VTTLVAAATAAVNSTYVCLFVCILSTHLERLHE
jgi:hypothetical protein